jgi:hypothetical protein
MTATITDDVLVAYVDDELEPAQRGEVERSLASDPALQRKARAFAESAAFLRRGLEAKLHEPLPEHLLRVFDCGCAADAAGDDDGSTVVPLPAARRRPLSAAAWPQWAAAAALLLMVGGGLGFFSAGVLVPEGEPMIAGIDPTTARVLDREASGTPGEIMPLLTFRDHDGRLCREYEVTASGAEARQIQRSVACRASGGGWTLVASTYATAAPAAAGQGYVPAAGAPEPAIDLMAQLIAGAPLTPAAERAAIESDWRLGQ